METKSSGSHVIEVCTGPDCSRGGAAILEIEELSLESGSQHRVVAGGCRNFCGMGPNVHYNDCHFTKVKSSEDCQRFAKTIGMQLPHDGTDDQSPKIACMMTKKANRVRWQVLRDVVRRKNIQASTRNLELWQEQLQVACQAELGAARMYECSLERADRAHRRVERLQRLIEKLVRTEKNADQETNYLIPSPGSSAEA